MLMLPHIWPDETLYSLFAKIVRLNGLDHLKGAGILAGEERPATVSSCPVDLKRFCEVTRGAYGSPHNLLYEATVFPALAHLGEMSGKTLYQVESGALRPDLGTLAFGLNKGRQWRICRECVDRDRELYGLSYWHRHHQLPTSYFCIEHGVPLDRLSPGRVNLLDHLIFPSDCVHEMHSVLERGEPMDLPFKLSVLGRDALSDKSAPFLQEVTRAAYKDELEQIGLLTTTGRMQIAKFNNEFRKTLGKNASICPWTHHPNSSNPKPLLNGIIDKLNSKPFARLLLTQFLFGSWGAFKERCKWQDMAYQPSVVTKPVEVANTEYLSFAAMQGKQRQACLDYKATRISPTRHEFRKLSNRAFRWLRQNDRAWLDQELPILNIKGQGSLFD